MREVGEKIFLGKKNIEPISLKVNKGDEIKKHGQFSRKVTVGVEMKNF